MEVLEDKIILVVEDERSLAEAIRIKLENSGFAVTVARTAEQALNYLEDLERIDAIWLDHYLLGKENGLDIVFALKGNDCKWKQIPIFVVSNTATVDKVQSYMQLGVNKYYVKSNYRLDAIIEDLKKALRTTDE